MCASVGGGEEEGRWGVSELCWWLSVRGAAGLIDEIVELEKAMEPEGARGVMDPVKAFAGVSGDEDPLKHLP